MPGLLALVALVALGAALAAAVLFAARARARRDLALARVRARIAEDLHDDIGSSLSRISILSELARRKAPGGEVDALLAEIAETARALVGSMSDAVWSIDPAQDDLRHVVARMRSFASDVLDGKEIAWTFQAPEDPRDHVPPETRRELFLVFKEAVTNVARHSGATHARLALEIRGGTLNLEVADDGKGFDAAPARDLTSSLERGRGLLNMQVRALRKGGRLTVTSAPGRRRAARARPAPRRQGAGVTAPAGALRAAVVEDDDLVREGLRVLIDGSPGLCCVGAWASVEDALVGLPREVPDVLLMDIALPGMSGVEGVRVVRARHPSVEVLMLTVLAERAQIFESICNGACGYLLKDTPPARLLEALREAKEGGAPMSPEIARKVVELFRRTAPPPVAETRLTEQETRLLGLLADGHGYRAAADQLFVSVNTVRNYIRSVYEKLHVHSSSEAVSKALRLGLIS